MAALQFTHLDWVGQVLAEKFPQLDVRDAESCWLWKSRSGRHPSGFIRVRTGRGRRTSLPRVAFELLTGSVPESRHLWHTCESGYRCANPTHLRVGSPNGTR